MSLVLDGTLGVTFPASQTPSVTAYQGGVLTSGTAVASTSGTAIDFTSIPSWVKRITVMFNGVSTSGASPKQIQLGSGTIQTTGYSSYAVGINTGLGTASSTTGLLVENGTSAPEASSVLATLCLISTNTWVYSFAGANVAVAARVGGGNVTLSGTLDRVRITTVNGTDTFDAGSINILYE